MVEFPEVNADHVVPHSQHVRRPHQIVLNQKKNRINTYL